MSLARTTFKPLFAALAVAAAAVPLAACGREEADLTNGKAQFVQACGSCHSLARAGTQGQQGPDLDTAFQAALADGIDRDTVEGIVRKQIGAPRRNSVMQPDIVTGDDARDVSAYIAYAAARSGEDEGALAQAGLAGATGGKEIFTAAGCGSCHVFSDAGTNGNIGPNLDELAAAAAEREPGKDAAQYTEESILDPDAFTVEGFQEGVMPSYEGRLDEKQIQALVDYLLGDGG